MLVQNLSKSITILVIIATVVAVSCLPDSDNDTDSTNSSPSDSRRTGARTYRTYCVTCHGADGTLKLNGAADLSISTLTYVERVNQIANGKGLMTPYKNVLTPIEIAAVARYTETLTHASDE